MKRYLFTGTLAAMCAAVGLSAQSAGQQQDPAQPTTQTQTDPGAAGQAMGTTTTLTGCVYKEEDVPGRSPNIAEQAGIMEDYILAETEASGSPSSAAGAATAGSMYKLEHADDEQLSSMVGKRVEVTGRVDAEADDSPTTADQAATQTDESVGPDQVELPEFEVTAIRETSGDCPPRPGEGQ